MYALPAIRFSGTTEESDDPRTGRRLEDVVITPAPPADRKNLPTSIGRDVNMVDLAAVSAGDLGDVLTNRNRNTVKSPPSSSMFRKWAGVEDHLNGVDQASGPYPDLRDKHYGRVRNKPLVVERLSTRAARWPQNWHVNTPPRVKRKTRL
jgi:hypothetical protein